MVKAGYVSGNVLSTSATLVDILMGTVYVIVVRTEYAMLPVVKPFSKVATAPAASVVSATA